MAWLAGQGPRRMGTSGSGMWMTGEMCTWLCHVSVQQRAPTVGRKYAALRPVLVPGCPGDGMTDMRMECLWWERWSSRVRGLMY